MARRNAEKTYPSVKQIDVSSRKQMPAKSLSSLVLVYHCSTFFRFGKHLQAALQAVLSTANAYFGFHHALLLLLRANHKPIYLEAGNPDCAEHVQWVAYFEKNKTATLAGLYPAANTNLPMIVRAGDPVGVIEIGVFHHDTNQAKSMLHKAVPLARHIADLVQESLIQGQKKPDLRRLSVWLETVSAISSTLDIKQVLHLVSQLAADLLRGRCSILLLDEETGLLVPEVAVGAYDPVLKKNFKALKGREPFPGIARAIRTQQPVVITPDNMGEMVPSDVVNAFDLSWSVIAPITTRGKAVGIMQVDRPPHTSTMPGNPFSPEEIKIIAAMARETGIALENAQLVEALAEKEMVLHNLMNKIITAQEDERKRVASDIHDGVIQALLGIWYRLQRLTSQLGPDEHPPDLKQELIRLQDDIGQQLRDIRRIVHNLRPIALDNYGLVPAMHAYIESLQAEHGPAVKLIVTGTERRLPLNVETTLYRVMQEALANVVQHAHARHVKVQLVIEESNVALEVSDDGQGFTPPSGSAKQVGKRLGLAGIEERALLLGGTCQIISHPGRGTRVLVSIPLTTANTPPLPAFQYQ